MSRPEQTVIIGAGAAGMMAAITIAEQVGGDRVVVLYNVDEPLRKLLLCGGGRCNISNRTVSADNYTGGSRNVIRRVLAACGVDHTIRLFEQLGVAFREEDAGKLYPATNRAQTVRDAILTRARQLGVHMVSRCAVRAVERDAGHLVVHSDDTCRPCEAVLIATGGCSYAHTGSDGSGYDLAAKLGHTIVEPVPALVPLVLSGNQWRDIQGITHNARVCVQTADGKPWYATGSMLWTHFGISGPAVLNASSRWMRARVAGQEPTLSIGVCDIPAARHSRSPRPDPPGRQNSDSTSDVNDPSGATLTARHSRQWLDCMAADNSKASLGKVLGMLLPQRVAELCASMHQWPTDTPAGQLRRQDRQRIAETLVRWTLPVVRTRGFEVAEATSGGVSLDGVAAATLHSRLCDGVYFAGEVLDVDGQVGGYNLQWAWSSGVVAGRAIARRLG